jgi:hypothetical protein
MQRIISALGCIARALYRAEVTVAARSRDVAVSYRQ